MKVNQVPTAWEEDRTRVLQEEEEEAIIKPAAEETGIPYKVRPSQSTIKPHYHNQDPPNHIHKNNNNAGVSSQWTGFLWQEFQQNWQYL